jgi:hypothetical protein
MKVTIDLGHGTLDELGLSRDQLQQAVNTALGKSLHTELDTPIPFDDVEVTLLASSPNVGSWYKRFDMWSELCLMLVATAFTYDLGWYLWNNLHPTKWQGFAMIGTPIIILMIWSIQDFAAVDVRENRKKP